MTHVFLSYVREDQAVVNDLAAELRREGLHVWLDRDDIAPGQPWQSAIRSAIKDGAFFLPCFSDWYHRRSETYMHDELAIAAEEFTRRESTATWLIPVRLSPCGIPSIQLSDSADLNSLQWVDLFEDWDSGVRKLLRIVRPQSPHSASTEKFFRAFCERHVQAKISRDISIGTHRFKFVEDKWHSLTAPSLWNPTFDIAMRLFEKLKERPRTLTERYDEPGATGRVLLLTLSPTPRKSELLRSLPGATPNSGSPYGDFIRKERLRLRQKDNWQQRDLVHWIWTFAPNEIEVDLLYWINLMDMLVCLGFVFESARDGKPARPIQSMYPGSLLTAPDFEAIVNDVLQEEIALCQKGADD